MIEFTERARAMVQQFLDDSNEGDLALRIGMSGSPVAPSFDLTLVGLAEQAADEQKVDGGGFTVLVKSADSELLEGATVDYVERVNESGFEVRPAGAKRPGSKAPRIPTGPIADRVRSVLETQVNPAIAAHGGMISLVDVEETDVYVEMSGGCQGCALSRMTLKQGVERMLREAVPELTAVHDVTDHASGDNPYL
jgi:Fe/S biogenesis protein NfuA